MKLKSASGVLGDHRIHIKSKGKFYKMVVRPIMLYDSECWYTQYIQNMIIEEMRMLRWMSDNRLKDRMINECTYQKLEVALLREI